MPQADYFARYWLRRWRCRLQIVWQELYIRPDEFDPSLDMNVQAMLDMDESKRQRYVANLIRRREVAHNLDLHGAKIPPWRRWAMRLFYRRQGRRRPGR